MKYERCLKFCTHFQSPTHSTPQNAASTTLNTQKFMRNQMRTTSYRNYGFIARCVCVCVSRSVFISTENTFNNICLAASRCRRVLIMQVRCFVSRSVNCGALASRDNGNACENDAALWIHSFLNVERLFRYWMWSTTIRQHILRIDDASAISDPTWHTENCQPAMRILTSPSIEWQSKGWN